MSENNQQSNRLSNEQVTPPMADPKFITALYHSYLGRSPDEKDIGIYEGLDQVTTKDLILERSKFEKETQKEVREREALSKQEVVDAAQADGQGGGDISVANPVDYGSQGWYFPQDSVLVTFDADPTKYEGSTNQNTVWLFNRRNRVMVPYKSEAGFNKMWEGQFNLGEAIEKKQINTFDPQVLVTPGNPFYNADMLTISSGIDDNGQMAKEAMIKWSYGRSPSEEKNLVAKNHITAILDQIKSDGTTGISSKLIDDILADKDDKMAELQNAYINGSYGVNEIWRDIMATQLYMDGHEEYKDFQAFDPMNDLSVFSKTDAHTKSEEDEKLFTPESLNGIPWLRFEDGVFFQDLKNFQAPHPVEIDPTSPEGKAEIEKIEAEMYDTAMQQMNANTEREKAMADDNWRIVKESIEKRYQVSLGNNAFNAWKQMKTMFDSMIERGVSGSGIENEARMDIEKDTRRNDKNLRWSKDQDLYEQRRSYYTSSASPEDIKNALANGDISAEEGKAWGITPNDETKAYFDIENLTEMYPNMTPEEIQAIHDKALDENENFRSPTYQGLVDSLAELENQKFDFQFDKFIQQQKDLVEEWQDQQTAYGEDQADVLALKGNELNTDLKESEDQGRFVNVPPADQSNTTINANSKPFTAVGPNGERIMIDPNDELKNPESVRTMPPNFTIETVSPSSPGYVAPKVDTTLDSLDLDAWRAQEKEKMPTLIPVNNDVAKVNPDLKKTVNPPSTNPKNEVVKDIIKAPHWTDKYTKPKSTASTNPYTAVNQLTGDRKRVDPTGKMGWADAATSMPKDYELETKDLYNKRFKPTFNK